MNAITDERNRLRGWLAAQLAAKDRVTVGEVDRLTAGHSAETLALTMSWSDADGRHARDVVLRLRPPAPGLLEPYDLGKQFAILRALEATPVPAPRVFWREPTGAVLGREFYAMERCPGRVFESDLPAELIDDHARVNRMALALVEALAAIHRVDVDGVGLSSLCVDDPVGRDLDHWTTEIARVRLEPLPALELLGRLLAEHRPAASGMRTLVHGDAKPGNFAFVDDRVSAVFDWELATVGDPLTDVGYLEFMWTAPGSFTATTGAPSAETAVAHYAETSGIATHDRAWYRALAGYKLAAIMLVGAMLFDSGASDDPRLAYMGYGVQPFTEAALRDLGVDDPPDSGRVKPRRERMHTLRT